MIVSRRGRWGGRSHILRQPFPCGRDCDMRAAIVLIAFLPFLYYALRDARFHFVGRKVTFAEHVIHLAIGFALAIVLIQAVMGNSGIMLVGLLLLVVAGSADEYIWHRGLPEAET